MTVNIVIPALGESITQATIAKWCKQVGEAVTTNDILLELETDKVSVEVHAPANGVLKEITQPKGAVVAVNAIVGTVEEGAVATASAPASTTTTPASPVASPAAAKIAQEKGIDVSTVTGTGKDGRIMKGDVLQAGTAPAASAIAPTVTTSAIREERVAMSTLRKRIAERLKHSQNTAAILTTFNEIDMSAAMDLRKQYNESFEKKHGVKLGFMSLFVRAVVHALKEVPAVNAEIDGEDIVYKHYYDIGVAVGTDQGLVVPIVRNADQLSLADIEKTIAALGKKGRDGKLTLPDLSGGTFTISNGGIYGSLMSTPIINPPQSGILGMHKIQERPVVVHGEIKIRPMMYVALSYDHRIIDGKEAVTFLVRVKEAIEDPRRLLLQL